LQKLYATSIKKLPARVVGDGDSIATVATAVLASPYITGAVIDVDGGGLLI
jgi:hypothetical protein